MNADSGIVNTHSGEWQKAFTFDQNPCSRSSRIAVHVRPEWVFTLPQNMQLEGTPVRVLNIDGLIKTKTDYREIDILDKRVLTRIRDELKSADG